MGNERHTEKDDPPKKTPDTTGGSAAGSDKGAKTTEPAKDAGADASNALLDGTIDPTYTRMAAGYKAGGIDHSAKSNGDLQKKGILNNLTVADNTHPAPKAKDAPAAPAAADASDGTPKDAQERQRLAYMQATVQNFLPVVLAPEKGQADANLQRQIAQKQEAIKQEAAAGKFGPASREAYDQYVTWLEKTALPSEVRDLKMFKLPMDEPGEKGMKAPPANLHINRNEIPDDAQLKRLDEAVRWAQNADTRVQAAQKDLLQKVDKEFTDTVNKLGLPKGWIQDIDRDHSRWRTTVGPLINDALSARSNIEVLDEMNKAGATGSIEDLLPPNANVKRDATGKITGIHLDLPQGWDMNNPDNKKKAADLHNLVSETNALVAPQLPQLRTIASHPERALNWGDTEVSHVKGRFDANNNFLGLVDEKAKAQPGEHFADVNLLESRFDIQEKDGKIVVNQHVQAQHVPWWGYQNLIGVDDVGKKIEISHTYNPTDNVLIRTDSGYEVKQAKDLSSYKNWQQAKHYGGKTLMGVLDAGMLVTGTIEVGAAFKAARVAGLGAEGLGILGRGAARTILVQEGTEYTGRQLAMQAGKGMLRTTVGVTGVLNNAGARENSLGQTINTARSVYFLADAGLGVGQGGVRLARSVLGRSSEVAATSRGLAGLTAGSRAENFYKLSHGAFKVSEFGFVPLVTEDLTRSIRRINNDTNKHVVRAAEIVQQEEANRPQLEQ